MRVGYSHWGFLGDGVADTPDGGRSHRKLWVQALTDAGHDVVFLQRDRDRLEAGTPIVGPFSWDGGFPDIDLLFLEWRWLIPGRNDEASRGTGAWTPDLSRQRELIEHYTVGGTPTLIWDKDMRLDPDDSIRSVRHVVVCEAALWPRAGARSLLFPVSEAELSRGVSDPPVSRASRDLVYIGNQYDRDRAFGSFIAEPARTLPHSVFGKWTRTRQWPHVRFCGRIPFRQVAVEYAASRATVAILPDRYAGAGQMTQRLAEAVLSGCAVLVPSAVRGAERMVPPRAVVANGREAHARMLELRNPDLARDLIVESCRRLNEWSVARQVERFHDAVRSLR